MELKCNRTVYQTTLQKSSNRTFMELKFDYDKLETHEIFGSNRTFMELKCNYLYYGCNLYR